MTRLLPVALCLLAAILGCGSPNSPQARSDSSAAGGARPGDAQPSGRKSDIEREFLEIADRLESGLNPFLGSGQIPILEKNLDTPNLPPPLEGDLRVELSNHLLRLGRVTEAIEQLKLAHSIFRRLDFLTPQMLNTLHQKRALAYLRQAEVSNCIKRHNRDCCIFPLRRGGVHVERLPAVEARACLLEALAAKPDSFDALWLLNIASMAAGENPASIPPQFRISPEAFESDLDIERFVDVAPSLGVNTFNLCGGAIVEDFDNDGLLDIVTSTYDPRGPLAFYHNGGDGSFEDRSQQSRLSRQLGGLNCIGGDYDGDGDIDILVLRGAWLHEDGKIRNSLLRNNGDGTFTDVTRAAGLAEPACPTQAAAWGDFDNDGDLDLYVANESPVEFEGAGADYPAQLFRNNANGTFTDVAAAAGVANDRFAKGVAAGDFDNDGDLDLYVSNVGPNRLYRNNADGTFTDVAATAGVVQPTGRSFASWFFDYDNDGWLDLFVAAYETSIGDIAADYLGQTHDGVPPRLYHNNRDGTFSDVAQQAGLAHPYLPMGANFGDIDYDGYLDIYLATGDPGYESLTPNVMLRNDAGRRFQDVTTAGGLGHLQKGHGVAFGDLDNDGDLDLYHQLGGFFPGDRFHNALFENPGNGNRFVVVKLVGQGANASAIGARIRVTVETPHGVNTIHRAVGSVSSFGGSPLRQEIGLGSALRIEQIDIDWPRQKLTQTVAAVPLDAMIEIVEGQPGFRRREFRKLKFQVAEK